MGILCLLVGILWMLLATVEYGVARSHAVAFRYKLTADMLCAAIFLGCASVLAIAVGIAALLTQ